MNAKVNVSLVLRASIVYRPLVPVSVPMLVPFTTTRAPGNGLPSAVEVTVPVTRTGGV